MLSSIRKVQRGCGCQDQYCCSEFSQHRFELDERRLAPRLSEALSETHLVPAIPAPSFHSSTTESHSSDMSYGSSPGTQPIYNPPVPFCTPIHGGLRPGMSVFLQGKVPHHPDSFFVNFKCGQSDGADIAFHFNPRFNWFTKVVCNSFEGGSWHHEEKKHEMPFHKGENFELIFIVNADFYQVNVNGTPFCEFMHRIPLERVECLEVNGDLTIESINFTGGGGGFSNNMGGMGGGGMNMPGYQPGNLPGMTPDPSYNPTGSSGGMNMSGYQPGYQPGGMNMAGYQPGGMNMPGYQPGYQPGGVNMPGYQPGYQPFGQQGMMPDPAYNPAGLPGEIQQSGGQLPIPYRANIYGGLSSKQTIVIRGVIPNGANRFHINFLMGCSGDIALHINPRLTENCVMRNSFFDGCWGEEELEISYNPFVPAQPFEVSIRCGNYRFKVYVNGQHLFNFEHRYREFQEIDTIEIGGDIILSSVEF